MSAEQVLVVDRNIIEEVGVFNGIKLGAQPYLDRIFAPGVAKFMLRSEVEQNHGFKQIIPYVLMRFNNGTQTKFFSYRRGGSGGESRLIGNRSVGVGGHINPIDSDSEDPFNTYLAAVQREVSEEVYFNTQYTEKIVAVLNDDSNDVGKVHFGIVHIWELDKPEVKQKESQISYAGFLTKSELLKNIDTLETWSKFCMEAEL